MITKRATGLSPFRVMEILAEANKLTMAGRDIIHLEIGEPDLPTPKHIVDAGIEALMNGFSQYTSTEGLYELREAIAERYQRLYNVTVDPERIIITMGSSPAPFLIWSSLLEPGEEVIVTEPHYGCYPGEIEFLGGKVKFLYLKEEEGFSINPEEVRSLITPKKTKAILINSPSNPTGQIIPYFTLKKLVELAEEYNIKIVSDEIYHQIEYDEKEKAHTLLEFSDNHFVIDGFSKRYRMTGWRIGWIVAPKEFIYPLRKIHQNFFLSASSFVQKGALAAIKGPQEEIERMVSIYNERRVMMLSGLRQLGFKISVEPKGAFYIFADASLFTNDSIKFAKELLINVGVAIAPGIDFGHTRNCFLRFSYATKLDKIKEGLERLKNYLTQ